MSPPTIVDQIAAASSRVFRRAYIKRRDGVTGLFESSWQEITRDVKNWGKIRTSVDFVRYSRISLSDVMMKVQNLEGKFNPSDDEASVWFGYADQQRTLVKIEAGFVSQTQGSNGIWVSTEYPSVPSMFVGVIGGDMPPSDSNEVTIPVRPLLQVFRDYPAANLRGWTATGMTASQFLGMVWDQTDGAGAYLFRPFFQDTTTYWNVTATSNVFAGLNTSGAKDVVDQDVWEVIQKLAEAEDMVAYVDRTGAFQFRAKGANTTGAQYTFSGKGFRDSTYGHTIKKVSRFGKKMSSYYSRVEVKWIDSNTSTSVRVQEASLTVSGVNDAWNRGTRTYKFENFWIPTVTVADAILSSIFTTVSDLRNEIDFDTSFVPHLSLFDRVEVNYDSSEVDINSRWDLSNWAQDGTDTSSDLIWDLARGDAIRLVSEPFKLLSVEVDLDNLSSKFVGRET